MKCALFLLILGVSVAAHEVRVQTFDDRGDAVVGAKISVFLLSKGSLTRLRVSRVQAGCI
jgi:hypothetical protein